MLTIGLVLILFTSSSPNDRGIALNTICLGLATASIAVPLAGLISWVLFSHGIIPRLLLALCCGLAIIPAFLHVSAWDSAFGKLGWFVSTRGEALKPMLTGWSAAIWVHAMAATAQISLIFFLGRLASGNQLQEQARLEANSWSVFWYVTLPNMKPLIVLSVIWIVVSCSREIAATDLYQIGTLAEQIYLGFSLGQLNSVLGNFSDQQIEGARTMGFMVSVVVVLWLTMTSIWAFSRMQSLPIASDHQRPSRFSERNRIKSVIGILIILLVAVVPVCNLLIRASFSVELADGVPTPGYSIGQIGHSLFRALSEYRESFLWTSILAAVSASLVVVIASLLAWLSRKGWRWNFIFAICVAVTCSTPGPLIGSWLSKVLSSSNHPFVVWLYDQTIFAPVLANVIFCFPIGALLCWFVLRNTASDAQENASLEGASSISNLIRLGVFANAYAFLGIWILTFAYCFGELSASQMVLPPGIDTIPRVTLGLLHSGVDEMTAALTIVTVFFLFVVSGIGCSAIWLNNRRQVRQ